MRRREEEKRKADGMERHKGMQDVKKSYFSTLYIRYSGNNAYLCTSIFEKKTVRPNFRE
jgi:hypothetical protein